MYEYSDGKFYSVTRNEVTPQDILFLINQPKKLRLEPSNKKIDSTGWKSRTTYEYVD